ncbi:V-type proton ATPase subunit e 2-like isoform X2 [Eurytemora carolleeae]|uniref:V-type proton ATPase subunit e 2-like isoform X2 n=1 Tax=Eurytemora carolleeae TaxID=1294199 RepID=UPI000C789BC7|nr:V-type proton ATPase subunit e 2-like isoform X2 [Eurytemora carolleeae]|eukprot:XP_023342600.1 V-type proton ATPase subunit e 2-like isoform X2 [Eurytemora affinis]
MVAHWLPVLMFTLIWGLVGGVAPKFVPRGPHQSLIQMSLLLTGICCWLFWLCCYMSQMNPLIGPELDMKTMIALKHYWGDFS